ncbi:hypothetical protein BpHYR1_046567 [Brachionus plicatilis]|uniref:Uncharacterized protein n=1 Tax=Brachionus plicatilis TaxID=10195 RepID=A0A3M7QL69_BRAPC|nr:hypothetical protein BpHYR1_046567 [Brachionus plicatilis]
MSKFSKKNYLRHVLHFFKIEHLLNRIKRTSIITKKFFGSSRLGELWFINSWNNFCSQCTYQNQLT